MRKVILVIAILFIAAFLFFVVKKTFMDKAEAPSMPTEQQQSVKSGAGKKETCKEEMLKCPDGTYVKRIGDTCEYQQCPGERIDVPMEKPAGL